jgi:hypothetical protein
MIFPFPAGSILLNAILFLLPGSVFLVCLAGAGPAKAAQSEWQILQTVAKRGEAAMPPVEITYTVSAELTRIASPAETVFIDYKGSRLFRHNPADGSCLVFPFGRPHADLPIATYVVFPGGKGSEGDGRAHTTRHISFGTGQALSQMMIAPTLRHYGQDFPVTNGRYTVNGNLAGLADLLVLSAGHRRIFQDYPLLRRIDPLGLVDLLEGFPVRIKEISPAAVISSTLSLPPRPVAGEAVSVLPQDCLAMASPQ